MANEFAPAGAVYVCAACGKTSSNRYGEGSRGWDESCMLNAVLCHDKKKFDEHGHLVWWPYKDPAGRAALSPDTQEAEHGRE